MNILQLVHCIIYIYIYTVHIIHTYGYAYMHWHYIFHSISSIIRFYFLNFRQVRSARRRGQVEWVQRFTLGYTTCIFAWPHSFCTFDLWKLLRLTGRKWEILRSLCDHGKVSWMALNYPVKDSLRYFDVFWQSLVPPQALADGVWLFKLPGSPCPSWVRPPHTHPNNIPDRQRCETWNIASGHFLPFQAPAVKDDAEEKIRAGFGWQSPSKGQHAQNGAAYVSFFWQSKLLEGIFTVALETLVIY